jgi:hypothetical protein
MKKNFRFISVFVLLFITLCLISSTSLKRQPATEPSNSLNRAAQGDTVWVVLNRIKSDKCHQFEKIIHEIFWPKAEVLPLDEQQAFAHTRFLHPVKMNDDSSYVYVFLMDPVLPGANYSILYYLKKMYGQEQGKAYFQMFQECYVQKQEGYAVIQSAH